MIKYQGISTLEVLLEAKNYNKWIAEEILKNLSGPALEIGAGTGNLTEYCKKTSRPLYITDKDYGLIKHLKKRFKKEKNIFVKPLDISKKPPKEFTGFFEVVYSVNVLEHIKNDEKALKNIFTMLKKDGKLILLVPAKKFAYSKLDKELGHVRRYEKEELEQKLITNGFNIEKIKFFNIVGLLSWYIRDKVKRKNINLKPYHIAAFDKIVPILKIIESGIKIPVGISLIAVARKSK